MSRHSMSNADAAWFHMDRPTNLMVVNAVLWFDEPIDMDRGREIVRERLVERFPRFRQRVVAPPVGQPMWEDDPSFDLERHVHHLALPAPGDRQALQVLVADLWATPLDRSKPLWDLYVVDGFGTGQALISRMHHCIADGIALARVLLSLTDEQPGAGLAEATETGPGHARFDALIAPAWAGLRLAGAGLDDGRHLLANPASELPDLLAEGAADVRALSKLLLTGGDAKTVLKGKLGATRRVTWSEPMALDEIKSIGGRTGTTINDVVVAAMTGALRWYLQRRGSLVPEIRAMVPFNLRPLDKPLPRDLGNRFGLVYLSLPVGISGPAHRLATVHDEMERIKRSPEAAVSYGILGLLGITPPQVEQRVLDVFSAKATAVMTNVPGPRQPVYFAGTKVAGVLGWVPTAGSIGVGVSIFSYDGDVTVGFDVDAGLVPDPETIIVAYEREIRTLAGLHPRRPRRDTATAR